MHTRKSNCLAPIVRRKIMTLVTGGLLIAGSILTTGCGSRTDTGPASQMAQAATVGATVQPGSTQTVLPAATQAARATAQGGLAVRPTPTGTAPNPEDVLNVYGFLGGNSTLVRRDFVNLDNAGPDEVAFTTTGPSATYTQTTESVIGVLNWDSKYFQWNLAWRSDPITGTASPLLSAKQSNVGGLNGGDILRTGSPVIMARTTTQEGRAHLFLYKWNAGTNKAEPLKMAVGGAEKNAQFDADLDVNVADLNDDGVYEVVADNIAGVQIWHWDGQKFVEGEVTR